MSDRHMSSIFPECDKLKQIYDKCFSDFFQRFVSPNYRHQHAVNPCERLHEVYRQCVDELKFAKNTWVQTTTSLQISKMDPNMFPTPQVVHDNNESRFNQLERTLEQFQENARHMGVIASDFSSKSQEPLNQKIHTLISGLQEIDQLRVNFQDVKIPIELLTDVLDAGKNPQVYTKEVLERTLQRNKEVNGKTEIYKKFQSSLLKELGEEMPEDTMRYRDARNINS